MTEAGDKILIRGLLVRGILGINEWEREKRQDIRIDLTLSVDCARPGTSDNVEDAVNYRTLTKAIIAYVEESSHFLVEALATALARICVLDFGVEAVVVRVEKPGALRFADSVGVEMRRSRADFAAAPDDS